MHYIVIRYLSISNVILFLYFFVNGFVDSRLIKRSYDSNYYECTDNMDFWVVEEKMEGEFNYNDLKNMFDEQQHELASQIQGYIFSISINVVL